MNFIIDNFFNSNMISKKVSLIKISYAYKIIVSAFKAKKEKILGKFRIITNIVTLIWTQNLLSNIAILFKAKEDQDVYRIKVK